MTELTPPKRWSEKVHRCGTRHSRHRPKKDPNSHKVIVPHIYTDADLAAYLKRHDEPKKPPAAPEPETPAQPAPAPEVPP
jgi:hypothetical protein